MTTSDDTITLAEAFGQVTVTRAEASIVLAALASDLRDTHESLYTALMTATQSVMEPTPPTRSTSTSSTSKSSTSA